MTTKELNKLVKQSTHDVANNFNHTVFDKAGDERKRYAKYIATMIEQLQFELETYCSDQDLDIQDYQDQTVLH